MLNTLSLHLHTLKLSPHRMAQHISVTGSTDWKQNSSVSSEEIEPRVYHSVFPPCWYRESCLLQCWAGAQNRGGDVMRFRLAMCLLLMWP